MSVTSASATSAGRLEPFLLLAKSSKGAAAAQSIIDATAAPGVYVFNELLALPSIQELQSGPHEKAFALLQLFAYGTISDWASSPDAFPKLRPSHISKLRHLTLLTLAFNARTVRYADLMSALLLDASSENPTGGSADGSSSAASTRALEDCIIEALYAGTLAAKLNQRQARLEVEAVLGRDIKGTEELADLERQLAQWSTITNSLLASLTNQMEHEQARDALRVSHKAHHREDLAQSLSSIADKLSNPNAFSPALANAAGHFGSMDIDVPRKTPHRKRTRG
ncbi:COP9 signalosome, subunit CSN7 [Ceraceosorus bombacis]|uniref:COP9 signalosome, subunit CSN7 n=1 Tax=Ceraceosorus bombacis TaxID=401625 RepID=A0A0P1BBA1_9BASI|nr:COP9 signalosome, subunit CSN7 [Ceraceosorus bombacis]